MINLQETSNYTQFKKLEGNRTLDPNNLKNLETAIKKSNYLKYHPIIVNKDMYVIDGHHRLQVAENLDVPVYYLIDETKDKDEAYEHILTSNVNQKNWTLENYFNLYAQKDQNPNYIEFLNLMGALQLRPKALLGLITASYNGNCLQIVKNGEFKLPSDGKLLERVTMAYFEFKNFVEERKIKPSSMFTSSYFTNAFRMLMANETLDVDLFFQKLENRWFELRPQATPKDWLELLLSIYNWKNHNKILIE